jgi:hypothetical protein
MMVDAAYNNGVTDFSYLFFQPTFDEKTQKPVLIGTLEVNEDEEERRKLEELKITGQQMFRNVIVGAAIGAVMIKEIT